MNAEPALPTVVVPGWVRVLPLNVVDSNPLQWKWTPLTLGIGVTATFPAVLRRLVCRPLGCSLMRRAYVSASPCGHTGMNVELGNGVRTAGAKSPELRAHAFRGFYYDGDRFIGNRKEADRPSISLLTDVCKCTLND